MTIGEHESIRLVREANPVSDPAQLARDDPEKAVNAAARAKAHPVAEPAGPTLTRHLIYAFAALILTTLVAALLLTQSDESTPGIVDRAVAATTADSAVFHTVERVHVRRVPEEPTLTGPYRIDSTTLNESWYASDGRAHVRTYALTARGRGALLFEFADDGFLVRSFDARTGRTLVQPSEVSIPGIPSGQLELRPFEDPGSQLRALRDQGAVRVDGQTSVDGQPALQLASSVPPADLPGLSEYRVEFLVDADTFRPLEERRSMQLQIDPEDDRTENTEQASALRRAQETGRTSVSTDVVRTFLTYEKLPLTAENAAQLRLGAE